MFAMNGHSSMIANAPTLKLTRTKSLEMPDSPPQTPLPTSPIHLYKPLNGSNSMETLLETNYKNSLDQFSPTHFTKQWTESSIVVKQKMSSSPTHHSRTTYGSPTHHSGTTYGSPIHHSRSTSSSPTHRSQNVSPTHSIMSQSSSTRSPSPPTQNTMMVQQKSLNVTYKALSQSNNALDDFGAQNGTASQEPIRPRSTSTPHRMGIQRPKNLLASAKMNGEASPEETVKETVLKAIGNLHGLTDFANQSAKMYVKSIGDCYWKNEDQRQHIADVFASNGGAGK